MPRAGCCAFLAAFLLLSSNCQNNQPFGDLTHDAVIGRWDITITDGEKSLPSWFELIREDSELTGRFVGTGGHARPILFTHFENGELQFSCAPQHEQRCDDLFFTGSLNDGRITGKTTNVLGEIVPFVAVRAPELKSPARISWGQPIRLLPESGSEFSQWRLKHPERPDGWSFEGGILTNTPPSTDLLTIDKYKDFRLHVEFRMPKDVYSNSGVYLRGRYEVQIAKSFRQTPHNRGPGGVYGFITPGNLPLSPDGEWNTYDITLVGRRITLVFNGETVIDDAEIPGITGGALDSREGEPGPIMLQGDHAAISYRNIVITPAL